jgi:hypothetical protein
MTTTARATWNARPTQLVAGDRVRVTAYGLGAQKTDVGRTGVVTKVNKTRVVVGFDQRSTWLGDATSRTIDGDCLRLLDPRN